MAAPVAAAAAAAAAKGAGSGAAAGAGAGSGSAGVAGATGTGSAGAAAAKSGAGAQAAKVNASSPLERHAAAVLRQRALDAAAEHDSAETGPGRVAEVLVLVIAVVTTLIVTLLVVVILLPVLLPMYALDRAAGLVRLPAGAQPFYEIYQDAADVYGQNPFLLMAIHESESTFSTGSRPGIRTGVNDYGCCAGPMQFDIDGGATPRQGGRGGTWGDPRLHDAFKRARLSRPASYPGRVAEPHPNVYDSYDAIYAAAAYLEQLGARRNLAHPRTHIAVAHYKAGSLKGLPLAAKEIARATVLQSLVAAGIADPGSGVLPLAPGDRAKLLPNGLAAAPEHAPQAVKDMIRAANAISDRPYRMAHFPTHVGNPTYDCSSSTSHVLWAGGKFGLSPWCSAQFVRYGEPGLGRWVSIYAVGPCGSTGHVFMEIAGLRFDTSGGWDTGPNRTEGGPRWRTWGAGDRMRARIVARYVPRHPQGL